MKFHAKITILITIIAVIALFALPLDQTSNGFNVINSFRPAMTWSNSYYDYSYVN
jgi:hypothetical protein